MASAPRALRGVATPAPRCVSPENDRTMLRHRNTNESKPTRRASRRPATASTARCLVADRRDDAAADHARREQAVGQHRAERAATSRCGSSSARRAEQDQTSVEGQRPIFRPRDRRSRTASGSCRKVERHPRGLGVAEPGERRADNAAQPSSRALSLLRRRALWSERSVSAVAVPVGNGKLLVVDELALDRDRARTRRARRSPRTRRSSPTVSGRIR